MQLLEEAGMSRCFVRWGPWSMKVFGQYMRLQEATSMLLSVIKGK